MESGTPAVYGIRARRLAEKRASFQRLLALPADDLRRPQKAMVRATWANCGRGVGILGLTGRWKNNPRAHARG
jgi:hypothetical protein